MQLPNAPLALRFSGSTCFRQLSLDDFDDFGRIRLRARPEPSDDIPTAVDEELLEVPAEVASPLGLRVDSSKELIQVARVFAVHLDLRKQVESHAVVRSAELLNLRRRAWLLTKELIARQKRRTANPRDEYFSCNYCSCSY